jgi:hypothetical protein
MAAAVGAEMEAEVEMVGRMVRILITTSPNLAAGNGEGSRGRRSSNLFEEKCIAATTESLPPTLTLTLIPPLQHRKLKQENLRRRTVIP